MCGWEMNYTVMRLKLHKRGNDMTIEASIPVSALAQDPIFQLNMVLWSLKRLPSQGSYHIRPLLKEAGYYLFAIDRRVLLPKDNHIVESLKDLTDKLGSPSPDIWLKHEKDNAHLIIELKSRGFSPESSKASQILKILIAVADLSLSVAAIDKLPGHLIIMTDNQDAQLLVNTLDKLKEKLEMYDLPCSPASVIGLEYNNEDSWIWDCANPSTLPQPLRNILSERVVVVTHPNIPPTDILPLYLVPWLPGQKGRQSMLNSDGLAVLTGRVLTYVLGEVRQASPPVNLPLEADSILHDATYGFFKYWNSKDKAILSQKVINIISGCLGSITLIDSSSRRIAIDIPLEETRENILKAIEKIEINNPINNLEGDVVLQPTLF